MQRYSLLTAPSFWGSAFPPALCQRSFTSLLAALCHASSPSSVITHLLLHTPNQRIHPLPRLQLPTAKEDSHVWISIPESSMEPRIFTYNCPQDSWMSHKHLKSVCPKPLTLARQICTSLHIPHSKNGATMQQDAPANSTLDIPGLSSSPPPAPTLWVQPPSSAESVTS